MKNLIDLLPLLMLPADNGAKVGHGTIVASNDSRFDAATPNEELTQFIQGLTNTADLEAELNAIAPPVPAPKRFSWRKMDDAADFFTETDDVRAIGAPFKQVTSTGTEQNGRTYNKGLTVVLDNDQMVAGDEQRWVGRLRKRVIRNEIVRAYAGMLTAAGTPEALVWNGKSNPDGDVATLLFQGNEARGSASNVVIYGGSAWLYRFLAYSGAERTNGGTLAMLKPADLAMLLQLDQVVVSKSVKQTSATTKGSVLGSYVIALNAQQDVGAEDPSNIKRFVSPTTGGGTFGVYVERKVKTTEISVEHNSNIIVTSTVGIKAGLVTQAKQQG